MIVYHAPKQQFADDVLDSKIEKEILRVFQARLGRTTTESEIASWHNSMQYMDRVLSDPEIPNDAYISIEFQIPLTSKRIDFIVTGTDENNQEKVGDEVRIAETRPTSKLKRWRLVEVQKVAE